jgi:hypothetical protein
MPPTRRDSAPAGSEPKPFLLCQVANMSDVPFVSIRQLLDSSLTPLGRLMADGRRLGAANTALNEFLDEPLKGRVNVARVDREILTLVAESPAWSARVRYLTPQILDHLRDRLDKPRLARVKIVTRPTVLPVDPPPRRRPRLSRHAAALIESVAKSSHNEALASALMRLAARADDHERD